MGAPERAVQRHLCFGCSPDNPLGLHLEFFAREDGCVGTRFTPGVFHQGYPGILHGGLVTTILDELMANHLARMGYWAVTARLEVRFRKPLPIGQELTFFSRLVKKRPPLFQLEAWAELPTGEVAAEARAEMMLRK
ncbi:MAG TPA: thioesterase [Peptococcaceae bacterium]|nr:thioesterase [Peptococcaceae bacterium]